MKFLTVTLILLLCFESSIKSQGLSGVYYTANGSGCMPKGVSPLGSKYKLVFQDPVLTNTFKNIPIDTLILPAGGFLIDDLNYTYYVMCEDSSLINLLMTINNSCIKRKGEISESVTLYTPNDYSLGLPNNAAYDLINIKDAWDITLGSPAVVIGISDGIIDTNHPDLINKTTVQTNFSIIPFFNLCGFHLNLSLNDCPLACTITFSSPLQVIFLRNSIIPQYEYRLSLVALG